jgi:hypothetical protein
MQHFQISACSFLSVNVLPHEYTSYDLGCTDGQIAYLPQQIVLSAHSGQTAYLLLQVVDVLLEADPLKLLNSVSLHPGFGSKPQMSGGTNFCAIPWPFQMLSTGTSCVTIDSFFSIHAQVAECMRHVCFSKGRTFSAASLERIAASESFLKLSVSPESLKHAKLRQVAFEKFCFAE